VGWCVPHPRRGEGGDMTQKHRIYSFAAKRGVSFRLVRAVLATIGLPDSHAVRPVPYTSQQLAPGVFRRYLPPHEKRDITKTQADDAISLIASNSSELRFAQLALAAADGNSFDPAIDYAQEHFNSDRDTAALRVATVIRAITGSPSLATSG